jgi:iron transport multicopper oxidase
MLDHCKALKIPTSGNVVGLNSTTDFIGQPYVLPYSSRNAPYELISYSMGPYPQTHILNLTPRAKGALAGTVMAALFGVLTIVWYSMSSLTEEEMHDVQQRSFEKKLARGAGAKEGGRLNPYAEALLRRNGD